MGPHGSRWFPEPKLPFAAATYFHCALRPACATNRCICGWRIGDRGEHNERSDLTGRLHIKIFNASPSNYVTDSIWFHFQVLQVHKSTGHRVYTFLCTRYTRYLAWNFVQKRGYFLVQCTRHQACRFRVQIQGGSCLLCRVTPF